MHPFERLRYVARSGAWLAPAEVATEAAWGLAALAEEDPSAVVVSARNLLSRHPSVGPLWWVAARLVGATCVAEEAARAVEELAEDPTVHHAASAMAGSGPVDVLSWGRTSGDELPGEGITELDALCLGPKGALCRSGAAAAVRAMREAGCVVWLRAGVGVAVPSAAWDEIVRLTSERRGRDVHVRGELLDGEREVDFLEMSSVDLVITPDGARRHEEAAASCGWILPPELRGIRRAG